MFLYNQLLSFLITFFYVITLSTSMCHIQRNRSTWHQKLWVRYVSLHFVTTFWQISCFHDCLTKSQFFDNDMLSLKRHFYWPTNNNGHHKVNNDRHKIPLFLPYRTLRFNWALAGVPLQVRKKLIRYAWSWLARHPIRVVEQSNYHVIVVTE